MKITMLGTGYVGLVSGTCFSEFGFDVCCVDKNKYKIKKKNDDCSITESENEVAKSLKNPNPKKYNIEMVKTKLTELLTEESFPLEIL